AHAWPLGAARPARGGVPAAPGGKPDRRALRLHARNPAEPLAPDPLPAGDDGRPVAREPPAGETRHSGANRGAVGSPAVRPRRRRVLRPAGGRAVRSDRGGAPGPAAGRGVPAGTVRRTTPEHLIHARGDADLVSLRWASPGAAADPAALR